MSTPVERCLIALLGAAFLTGAAQEDGWNRGGPLVWDQNRMATNTVLNYHALVIGINDYRPPRDGEAWPPLRFAADDAEAVAGILTREYGFTVRTLLNGQATSKAIIGELDRLGRLGVDDAVLIYFAGHGLFDKEKNEGFWIPVDARRRVEDRHAVEDWVWNSTLLKLFGASRARHVLVITDACFSGSLFRGQPEPAEDKTRWYQRAISVPSRYLITSGDLEMVLDRSGFSQSVQNFLRYPEADVFAASDLGERVQRDTSRRSGQLVRMGPLHVPSHAGGEFIFVRKGARLEPARLAPVKLTLANAPSRGEALRDAAALAGRGLVSSARTLAANLREPDRADPLLEAVDRHLGRLGRPAPTNTLQRLARRLEDRPDLARPGPDAADRARPRIVALHAAASPGLEPGLRDFSDLALLCLEESLLARPDLRLVDRASLDLVLAELDLSSSAVGDARAALALGRILPAGLLVSARLFAGPQPGRARLSARLVDGETSRVVVSLNEDLDPAADPLDACRRLAEALADASRLVRPLACRAREFGPDGSLVAGVGSFHGVRPESRFTIWLEPDAAGAAAEAVGEAVVRDLAEEQSVLHAAWQPGHPRAAVGAVRYRLAEVTRAAAGKNARAPE